MKSLMIMLLYTANSFAQMIPWRPDGKTETPSPQKKEEKVVVSKEPNTSVMICRKAIGTGSKSNVLGVIIATSHKSPSDCRTQGKLKAETMTSSGWSCSDKSGGSAFECNEYHNISYVFKGNEVLDHLTFTDLSGNSTVIAYANRGASVICDSDLKTMQAAGIRDGKCHRRK